jgi:4-hydroxybenzoate polyprenyltransferase
MVTDKPLVVDLDNTLILTDLLHESALKLLRERPLSLPGLALSLASGRAAAKAFIAERTTLDPETLPYHPELLRWLREEHARGRRLVLCTASHRKFAQQVADHLALFDEVIASDPTTNVKGERKAAAMEERLGPGGFDYVGDSRADLPVWALSDQAIVVGNDGPLAAEVAKRRPVARRFPRPAPGLDDWLRLLRVQQWLKNLLLFAPLLAAHRGLAAGEFLSLALAFTAFSLCASATYVLNDLFDLESDRLHPRKRRRALASGRVPVASGLAAASLLLAAGLVCGYQVGPLFFACLLAYLLLTVAYSWRIKRIILLDCIVLAMLYTLRIIAGAAAIGMGLSFWLLAFSVFLFLSLAFVKRYAELEVQALEGRQEVHGRGYVTADASLVQTLGISAGYAAALVLSLYLNSEEVLLLYATPQVVWGAVLVLLYWISWMWVQAHRGLMHDDPLVFALKDKTSLVAGALFLAVVYLGTLSWSW